MSTLPTAEEIDAAFAVIRRALLAGREQPADRTVAERDASTLERVGITADNFARQCRAGVIVGAVRTPSKGWTAPESSVLSWLQARQQAHREAHAHRRGRRDATPANDSTPAPSPVADAGPSNAELLAGAGLVPARAAGGRR